MEETQEKLLNDVTFNIHKFNIRPRPENKNHIVIFSCFSEFGSELVACLYCLPRLLRSQYLGYYIIAMGWWGRKYLYKHLVDEFWELKEDYQWLREYCRAYHHSSRNLKKLEKAIHRKLGKVVDSNTFSLITLQDLYTDLEATKKTAHWIPTPGLEAYKSIEKFIKPNSVGVTARYRNCYGRNLQIDFYKKLLDNLQEKGYDPIWIGEQGTTYECPYSHITNFRDTLEANDLEKTLALVSKLQFTIQFWTASSRLAGIMGTPFILFESPDQVYGGLCPGHEGLRLELCTRGKRKVVLSHFKDIYENNQLGLDLVTRAIEDIKENNYKDIVACDENILGVSKNDFIKNHKVNNIH